MVVQNSNNVSSSSIYHSVKHCSAAHKTHTPLIGTFTTVMLAVILQLQLHCQFRLERGEPTLLNFSISASSVDTAGFRGLSVGDIPSLVAALTLID